MPMNWTDICDIAIELDKKYPDIDVAHIRFTDLFNYITGLENFEDNHKKCNEKILEAIQMAWLEEKE